MASPTVIDQLIIKLGLDPTNFTKGQKTAAAEMVKTKDVVKKSSDEMGASIAGFGKKLLGIATIAVAVKKSIGYVSDLSTQLRQLGIDARNYGVAANELKNFQNVSEMFGGKAEDATRTVGNLTKSLYDLAYNGTVSDSLVMLARLGVHFQDTAGHARGFKDVVLDTQQAIQTQLHNGTSYENANQMLLQAGFDPGLATAMLQGKVSEALAQQQNRRQVTGSDVGKATDLEKSATNRDQAIEAAVLRVLPAAANAGIATNNAIASAAEGLSDAQLSGSFESIGEILTAGGKAIEAGVINMVTSLERAANKDKNYLTKSMIAQEKESRAAFIQSAADKFGVDPNIIKGIIATESSWNPNAEAKDAQGNVTGKGLMGLNPKYHKFAGLSANQDIIEGVRDLFNVYNDLEKKGFSGDDLLIKSLQSYNAGETRVLDSLKPGGKPLSQETLDYPGKVLGFASGAVPTPNARSGSGGKPASTTQVTIGDVTVNTQATDANGVARDFVDATQRKFNAAQADVGMQQ